MPGWRLGHYNWALSPPSGCKVTSFRLGPWLVEAPLNRLSRNGQAIHLEPKVMQVLLRLAKTPLQVVKKDDLIRSVWTDTFVTDDVLTRSISELRKAFEDHPRQPAFIETIPKSGYRLLVLPEHTNGSPLEGSLEIPATHGPPLTLPSTNPGLDSEGRPVEVAPVRKPKYVIAVSAAFLGITLLSLALARVWRLPVVQRRQTIAVLPFVNLSGDPAEEYLSDGMTEEVITALAQLNVDRLGVIARTSAMHYKRTTSDVQQIARELGADYILEGSIRRAGDRIRVTAQLIETHDQTHLWAQDYEALDFNEIPGVQIKIRNAVAGALRLKTELRHGSAAGVQPEAYQLYLKGRYFLDRRDPPSLQKALDYFQQSAARDGNFAPAWASVALSYDLLEYVRAISPRDSYPRALSAVRRALQIDSESPEAHTALAYIHEHYEWNWAEADRELTLALTLDPNYELARQWYSYELLRRGDTQRAAAEMRRALALDPVSFRVNATMAERLERAGRNDDAIQQYQAALELSPDDSAVHASLAKLYGKKGEATLAAREYRRSLQLSGNPELEKRFDELNSRNGFMAAFSIIEGQELQSSLRALELRAARGEYVSPSDYAIIYALLGDRQHALLWLQRAYQEHASIMLELDRPIFDQLRDAPQFKELIQRLGMPMLHPGS